MPSRRHLFPLGRRMFPLRSARAGLRSENRREFGFPAKPRTARGQGRGTVTSGIRPRENNRCSPRRTLDPGPRPRRRPSEIRDHVRERAPRRPRSGGKGGEGEGRIRYRGGRRFQRARRTCAFRETPRARVGDGARGVEAGRRNPRGFRGARSGFARAAACDRAGNARSNVVPESEPGPRARTVAYYARRHADRAYWYRMY